MTSRPEARGYKGQRPNVETAASKPPCFSKIMSVRYSSNLHSTTTREESERYTDTPSLVLIYAWKGDTACVRSARPGQHSVRIEFTVYMYSIYAFVEQGPQAIVPHQL